jgi:hypothetical protein
MLGVIGIVLDDLDAYSGRNEGWTFNPPYFAEPMTCAGISNPKETATIRLISVNSLLGSYSEKLSIWWIGKPISRAAIFTGTNEH